MRSFFKHIADLISGDSIINTDIIGFTRTQKNPPDFISEVIGALNFFNINFKNNEMSFQVQLSHKDMMLLF